MWKNVQINTSTILGHGMCSIKDPETLFTSVYIFGGRMDGKLQNNVLKIHTETDKYVVGEPEWETKCTNTQKVVENLGNSLRNSKSIPDGREFHVMASLQRKKTLEPNKFVIFGGLSENKKCLNDTWTYDVHKLIWNRPKFEHPVFPSERYGHSFVSLETDELRFILFGGMQNNEYLNDIWILTSWSGHEDRFDWMNIPQQNHSSLYLLENSKKFENLLTYTGPCGRAFHSSVIIGTKMYVFGGKHFDTKLNDLWCLDLDNLPKWKMIEYGGMAPSPRYGHVSCAIQNYICIFGGISNGYQVPTELYLCETDKFEWGFKKPKDLPCGRFFSGSCIFVNDKWMIFGGVTQKLSFLHDVWVCLTGIEKRDKIMKYNLKQELGRGSFASVQLAIDETTQKEYALKRIAIHFGQDGTSNTDRLLREIEILNKFSHPNILKIVDSFLEPSGDNFIIVMPVCFHGTLVQYLKKKNISEFEVLNLAIQFLEGMAEVHSKGIVHRDIKPENILVSKNEVDATYILISDFGLATTMDSKPTENKTRRGSIAGTPGYMAPEIHSKTVSYSLDIWSIGIVLVYLFLRYNDFVKNWDFRQIHNNVTKCGKNVDKVISVIEGKFSHSNLKHSKRYLDWIKRCFDLSVEKRPTCEELLLEMKQLYESNVQNDVVMRGDSVPSVLEWLREIGCESEWINFEKNGLDDIFVISELNVQDLEHCNVNLEIVKYLPGLKLRCQDFLIQMDFSSVQDWLKSIDLEQYFENFKSQGFDTLDVVIEMTKQDLIDYGQVTKYGHIKKLLSLFEEVKRLTMNHVTPLISQ